jgi:hypothetical protein
VTLTSNSQGRPARTGRHLGALQNLADQATMVQSAQLGLSKTRASLQALASLAQQARTSQGDRTGLQRRVERLKGTIDQVAHRTRHHDVALLDGGAPPIRVPQGETAATWNLPDARSSALGAVDLHHGRVADGDVTTQRGAQLLSTAVTQSLAQVGRMEKDLTQARLALEDHLTDLLSQVGQSAAPGPGQASPGPDSSHRAANLIAAAPTEALAGQAQGLLANSDLL